jgi:hypothetical protein
MTVVYSILFYRYHLYGNDGFLEKRFIYCQFYWWRKNQRTLYDLSDFGTIPILWYILVLHFISFDLSFLWSWHTVWLVTRIVTCIHNQWDVDLMDTTQSYSAEFASATKRCTSPLKIAWSYNVLWLKSRWLVAYQLFLQVLQFSPRIKLTTTIYWNQFFLFLCFSFYQILALFQYYGIFWFYILFLLSLSDSGKLGRLNGSQ